MPIETIKLADIVIDEALQPHVAVNWDVTRDYGNLMREGAQFPPIRVYRIGGALKLSDGRHRVEARRFIRADDILAEVVEGSMRDALRHAVEFNAQHGLTFTREDQRRAIELYLQEPTMQGWSDRRIAERVHCSHTTVSAVRKKLYGPGPMSDRDEPVVS